MNVTWSLAKFQATTPAGPETLHVLTIDSHNGRVGYAFNAADWATLIEAMQEHATGLTIARALPEHNGRGHDG